MKTNDCFSPDQLLNIFKVLYKNEIFFNKAFIKEEVYYCYLIETKIIDKIEKNPNYEKIKTLIHEGKSYDQYKTEIKDIQIKLEELTPKLYKTSKELLTELLNDNKSFYLIKKEYLSEILDKNKLEGNEIKFHF